MLATACTRQHAGVSAGAAGRTKQLLQWRAAHGVFCAQSFIVSAAAAVETTCDATWLSTVRERDCIAAPDREKKLGVAVRRDAERARTSLSPGSLSVSGVSAGEPPPPVCIRSHRSRIPDW